MKFVGKIEPETVRLIQRVSDRVFARVASEADGLVTRSSPNKNARGIILMTAAPRGIDPSAIWPSSVFPGAARVNASRLSNHRRQLPARLSPRRTVVREILILSISFRGTRCDPGARGRVPLDDALRTSRTNSFSRPRATCVRKHAG